MSAQVQSLTKLPENKTTVFYSPIEGRDVLVRTGIQGDMINAILYAYSKDYIKLNDKKRKKLISKLTDGLKQKLYKTRWETASVNLLNKIPFQESVNKLFVEIYFYVQEGKKCRSDYGDKICKKIIGQERETYSIIFEIIPREIVTEILTAVWDRTTQDSIKSCKAVMETYFEEHFSQVFSDMKDVEEKRKKFIQTKFNLLLSEIFNVSEQQAYKKFIRNNKEESISLGLTSISDISNKFDRNFYFIDSKTRLPFPVHKPVNLARKNIILMHVGDEHYEIVGRLLPENRVQREFDPSDALVKRLYMFLYDQEKIRDEYPYLIPYIGKVKTVTRTGKVKVDKTNKVNKAKTTGKATKKDRDSLSPNDRKGRMEKITRSKRTPRVKKQRRSKSSESEDERVKARKNNKDSRAEDSGAEDSGAEESDETSSEDSGADSDIEDSQDSQDSQAEDSDTEDSRDEDSQAEDSQDSDAEDGQNKHSDDVESTQEVFSPAPQVSKKVRKNH